jgi:hypothetical protein
MAWREMSEYVCQWTDRVFEVWTNIVSKGAVCRWHNGWNLRGNHKKVFIDDHSLADPVAKFLHLFANILQEGFAGPSA